MGSVISKIFKKKREKTTYEKLESIEFRIKEIEEFSNLYQLKQKRLVGNLLLYGIGFSLLVFSTFYFVFLPKTTEKRIIFSIPIISLPALNLVAWYFQRKVNSNSDQLSELRTEKRKLLDQVKNKETYKDAVEILQRFGNDRSLFSTPNTLSAHASVTTTPVSIKATNTSVSLTPLALEKFKTPAAKQLELVNDNINVLQHRINAQTRSNLNRSNVLSSSSVSVPRSATKRLPFPIIDSTQKSIVDKMVDYLIGDGLSNRFAMICQQCFKHNGMALQEEYEYSAFRCAFCNFFNPAKKLRPLAPRLPTEVPSLLIQRATTLSESSNSSESDCEVHNLRKSTLDTDNHNDETTKKSDDLKFKEETIEKLERKDIQKKIE